MAIKGVRLRATLQIREIEAKNAVDVVETIQDLGLCSRGSGADNITVAFARLEA